MNSTVICSAKLETKARTYYFDLMKSVEEVQYVKISELISKPNQPVERHRIMIFEENFNDFLQALQNMISANLDNKSAMERQKALYPNAYKLWTPEDDNQLKQLFYDGKGIVELSQIFQRNKGAIISRINKLDILNKYHLNN